MLGGFGDIASLSVVPKGIKHRLANEFIVSVFDDGNKDCCQLLAETFRVIICLFVTTRARSDLLKVLLNP